LVLKPRSIIIHQKPFKAICYYTIIKKKQKDFSIFCMENERYLRELSKCIRCGSCKAFCPTYDEDKTEAMTARGRLVLLWGLYTGQLKPSAILIDRIFSCILCGACSEMCPPGVEIRDVIYHGRSLLKRSDASRRFLRFLTKFSIQRPDLSFRLLRIAQFMFPQKLKGRILPFLPELPESPLKGKNQVFTTSKKKGRVAVFTGCAVNFLYPHLGESLINILQQLRYEVIFPAGEVCCGIPLRTLGLEEEAKELARKNFNVFSRLNVEAILSLCPTCTFALKVEYPKLIGKGLDNVMDISSFFVKKLDNFHSSFSTSQFASAVYHDPCHLCYSLGIIKEPREIMKHIGIDIIETEREGCCGFGGIFSLSFREISEALLDRRIKDLMKTEAKTIITSCPGCMLQLSKKVNNTPVLHLVEVIEEALLQQT
jgi:glycolate oxidase iron-sulfur subunit